MSGIDNKNLFIINFCESFTTQPPVNRLMEIIILILIKRKKVYEVSLSDNFEEAKENIHQHINNLDWSNGFYRKDIGYKVIVK